MAITPKSRVIAALEHREGDHVPVGEFWADYEIAERALGHPTYQRAKWKEYVALWNGKRDEIVRSYGEWLSTSEVPKLFINGDPAGILIGRQREFCRTWPNQTEVTVPGTHFLQEDSPNEIGQAIAEWLKGLG